jgi:hypothetical protein
VQQISFSLEFEIAKLEKRIQELHTSREIYINPITESGYSIQLVAIAKQ